MSNYKAPEVCSLGSIASLTAGQQDGDLTDQDFPTDTPKGDLTFS